MIAEPIPPTIHTDKTPAEFFGYGVRIHKLKQGRFFVLQNGRILFTAKTRASAEQWIYSVLKQPAKTASSGKRSNPIAVAAKITRSEKVPPTPRGFWQRFWERYFLPLFSIFASFKRKTV